MVKKLYLCSILVFIVFSVFHYFYAERFLDFSLLASCEVSESELEDEFAWISLISEDYDPMWTIEYIETKYVLSDEFRQCIDTKNYSYIVTFGHELKSLSYRNIDARTKYLGIFPNQRIGIVKLSIDRKPKIFIYQIKRMNIVNDYYGNGKDMVIYQE